MKLKGQLEQAQLENLTSDPSNLPDGRIWLDTATDKAKFYDGTASRNIVTEEQTLSGGGVVAGTSLTQTFTNKTIDADANTITNIENADIKAGAAIAHSKLANLPAGELLVGSSGNVPTARTITGDVEFSDTGVASIATGVIVDNDINASAAIAYSKLNLTGAVVNADLAGSIAASKLVGTDIATVGTVTAGTWSASAIALNKGGTGQTTKAAAFDALSPMTTGGDLIYGGASGAGTRLANGTAGYVLTSAGGTSAPSWALAPTPAYFAPTVQRFTSGSGTYTKSYQFLVSSASATAGATYTNNSVTFTVSETISSATNLVVTASGDPTASGTLTKASGTGDSSITFTKFAKPLYIMPEVLGAGAGGGGSSNSSDGGTGGTGGTSTFGTSLLTATGGIGGLQGAGTGGAGGGATVNSPAIAVVSIPGTQGSGGSLGVVAANNSIAGGGGGNSVFGGAGGQTYGAAGTTAQTNSGSGGSGAGWGSSLGTTQTSGNGGGSGAYIKAIIRNPSATYSYAVGAAGSAGTAGTNGRAGGAGGSGIIIVTEYYQ